MNTGLNITTNKRVIAGMDEEDQLRDLSNKQKLICPRPNCGSQLVFKCGKIKVPHFAHKTPCNYSHSEPESERHLLGKKLLFNLLKKNYTCDEVIMEGWIPETNQEADVLLTTSCGKRIAYEIQYSTISEEKWLERHNLYQSAGVKDIWILGENLLNWSIENDSEKKLKILGIVSGVFDEVEGIYFLNEKQTDLAVVFDGDYDGKNLSDFQVESIPIESINLKEYEPHFFEFESYLVELDNFTEEQEAEEALAQEKRKMQEYEKEKQLAANKKYDDEVARLEASLHSHMKCNT